MAWKITGSCPAVTSASRRRITPGVVWPSIVIPTQCSPSVPSADPASWTIPAIAAAALSKIGREMPLSPRMSTTECMTQTSLSPTKGANARRPDAEGDTTSFGTPTGRACIAAAPISAPSAPPRHSTPWMRPRENNWAASARTPSCISATAAPREPAWRTASSVWPPAAATSSWEMSAAQCGSPRMPESMTMTSTRRAISRSRT